MPARHCFRSSGVAPRFCARHLAKNPPPAPSPPRPASASPLPWLALLPASAAELRGATSGEAADAGSSASQGSGEAEAGLGGEGAGGGFFARCLAQNRGATPEERKQWRAGIYDQIREVMPVQ